MKVLYHAVTRGFRYEIKAWQCDDNTFSVEEFKHGKGQAKSCGWPAFDAIRRETERRVASAAQYDGINYITKKDWD